MRFPPLRNAILTQVNAAGFSPDYDEPATTGSVKWNGTEDVLWSEVDERITTAEGSDVLVHRSLVVDVALGIDWAQGDVVTAIRDGDTLTGTVRRVKLTEAPQVPGVVRLELEDA